MKLKTVPLRFSLIELLVVVAIIAILAALLMPALSSARGRAREALCTGNEKQILLAVTVYTDANADMIPATAMGSSTPFAPYWWHVLLAEMGGRELFDCPVAYPAIAAPGTVGAAAPDYGWNYRGWGAGGTGSVGLGFRVEDSDPGFHYGGSVTTRQIQTPSRMLIFGERQDVLSPWIGMVGFPSLGDIRYVPPVHGSRQNIGLLDGHVEGIPSLTLMSAASRPLWTRAAD